MVVFIGTYLKVEKKEIKTSIDKTLRINEKTKEEFSKDVLFDPKTGDKLVDVTFSEDEIEIIEDNYDIFNYYYDNKSSPIGEDTFVCPEWYDKMDKHFPLFPNGGCKYSNMYDEDEYQNIGITSESIEQSKEEFIDIFSKEIEFLKKDFNLEVIFGAMTFSY